MPADVNQGAPTRNYFRTIFSMHNWSGRVTLDDGQIHRSGGHSGVYQFAHLGDTTVYGSAGFLAQQIVYLTQGNRLPLRPNAFECSAAIGP